MRINNNLESFNSTTVTDPVKVVKAETPEKLSYTLKIKRLEEDATRLAISKKIKNQIKGLEVDIKRAQNEISMLQTMNSTLTEVNLIFQKLKGLYTKVDSSLDSSLEKAQLEIEFNQIKRELDKILAEKEIHFKGSTESDNDYYSQFHDLKSSIIGTVEESLNLLNTNNPKQASEVIENTANKVSNILSQVENKQKSLERSIINSKLSSENLLASQSSINDAEKAKEMINAIKQQAISVHSKEVLIAQANIIPSEASYLLG